MECCSPVRRSFAPTCRIPLASIRNFNSMRGKRSEEHTSELQSQSNLVCRLLLEKKKKSSHSVFSSSTHVAQIANILICLLKCTDDANKKFCYQLTELTEFSQKHPHYFSRTKVS